MHFFGDCIRLTCPVGMFLVADSHFHTPQKRGDRHATFNHRFMRAVRVVVSDLSTDFEFSL